ncbi:MAG: hypothetical protein Q4E02_00780 [Lagierella massiliensis]|nr:hypothetical protein [Lagierella massiliensis]
MDLKAYFLILVYLCLAAFLISLTVFMFKLVAIVKELGNTIERNRNDIDASLRSIRETTENVSGITRKSDRLIEDISPDVRKITNAAGNVSTNVDGVVSDVTHTVEFVAESVVDGVDSIRGKLTAPKRGIKSAFFDGLNSVVSVIRRL